MWKAAAGVLGIFTVTLAGGLIAGAAIMSVVISGLEIERQLEPRNPHVDAADSKAIRENVFTGFAHHGASQSGLSDVGNMHLRAAGDYQDCKR